MLIEQNDIFISYTPKTLFSIIFEISVPNKFYHVADIHVFIGAQFNATLNKWLWNNGSPASFDSVGLTSCQQKALHYGYDWEFTNKECYNSPAAFACEIKSEAFVNYDQLFQKWNNCLNVSDVIQTTVISFPCNPSLVIVKWTNGLKSLKENISGLNIMVVITFTFFAVFQMCNK